MGNFQVVPLMESYRIHAHAPEESSASSTNQAWDGWKLLKILVPKNGMVGICWGFSTKAPTWRTSQASWKKKHRFVWKKWYPIQPHGRKSTSSYSTSFNGRSMRYMTFFLRTIAKALNVQKKGLGEMMYVWTPAHSHESLTIKYRNMATMNHETKTWGKAKNTALKYWTTELAKKYPKRSTLSLFNIAMENDHLQLIFPLKMVIFYSYVSLP